VSENTGDWLGRLAEVPAVHRPRLAPPNGAILTILTIITTTGLLGKFDRAITPEVRSQRSEGRKAVRIPPYGRVPSSDFCPLISDF
jgi:hypothetical protein